jgi:hypothetical protein
LFVKNQTKIGLFEIYYNLLVLIYNHFKMEITDESTELDEEVIIKTNTGTKIAFFPIHF